MRRKGVLILKRAGADTLPPVFHILACVCAHGVQMLIYAVHVPFLFSQKCALRFDLHCCSPSLPGIFETLRRLCLNTRWETAAGASLNLLGTCRLQE